MDLINHVVEAQKTLLQQYENKPILNSVIDTLVEQLQDIEIVGHQLLEERFIMTANATQLDNLGKLVGATRGKRTDYEYRRFLAAIAIVNRGGGTPQNIIDAIKIVYNPLYIAYREQQPVSFSVFIIRSQAMVGVITLLRNIKPVCVRFTVSFSFHESFFDFSEITILPYDYLVNDNDLYYINDSGINLVVRTGKTYHRDKNRLFAEKNENGIIYNGKFFIESYSNV